MSQSNARLQELARTLSNACYQLLQYTTLTEEQITESLNQLSKHANDLPVSWFTSSLIDALLILKNTSKPNQLASIVNLLSSWLRRYPTMSDTKYITVMDTVLMVALDTDDLEDIRLLQGMQTVITQLNERHTSRMADAIHAGVAHALSQTNCLNEFELEYCRSLLIAYMDWASRCEASVEHIMSAMEHVVDSRTKQKSRVEEDVDNWTQLVIESVKEIDASVFSLAVVAGSTRMLQFNQGVKSDKMNQLKETMELACIEHMNRIMTHGLNNMQHQDAISLIAAKSLIPMPTQKIGKLDNKALYLRYLSNTLLTHPDTFNSGQSIHSMMEQPKTQLQNITNTSLFKEMGRISRVLAKLSSTWIPTQEGVKEVSDLIDRLHGISYNIFFDWDQALMKHVSLDSKDVWTYLKSLLFSTTVILKAVAVDIPNGQGLVALPHVAQDIISINANLYFITQHLEDGAGRQAYQDTLTNAVAYLMQSESHCRLNKLLSLAFRDYATPQFVPEETPFVEMVSKPKQSRLIFFTDLVEQVIKHVEDKVLEEDILPVIYPIIKWKEIENQELYESAHTVVVSTFIAEKPISRELAAIYAKLLIESYPDPMNLDQLRFGFTTMINALCGLDDALAWLTVNHLIQKIDELDNVVLKNEYITVLIDLLKPLSLGPFFASALEHVKRLILAQETKEMQKATLKILFDTLSHSAGISDMQKTEAVGWYLELKQALSPL